MRHAPVLSAVPAHVSLVPFLATGETLAVASVPIASVPVASVSVGSVESDSVTSIPVASATVDMAMIAAEPLHDDEIALASNMTAHRRETFLAGRVALRSASRAAAPRIELPALLANDRGAPRLPSGVLGSISHKRTRAVAVALAGAPGHIGIDLEGRATSADLHRPSIAPRILTVRELDIIYALDPLAHRDATLLRFALKEAIYKAIDPIVQRYVGFTEVELDVHDDGRVDVQLLLPEFAHVAPAVHAQWFIDDVWFIALARSHP